MFIDSATAAYTLLGLALALELCRTALQVELCRRAACLRHAAEAASITYLPGHQLSRHAHAYG